MTGTGPGSVSGAVGGAQSATLARQAVFGAIVDVSGSTRRIASSLSKLADSTAGIGSRANGVFARYVVYGERQLRWIDAELAAATTLARTASEMDDPDMQLAVLRLTGPRLEAAMMGSLLLAAWIDFLSLADVVIKQHPFYSVERLFRDIERVQKMLEPSMRALSSLKPEQVEAAATDLPALMGHLTGEFTSTCEAMHMAAERGSQVMQLVQIVEMVTMVSAMRMSLPLLPPTAPATLGVGLVVGGDGVMMGTQIVVSAEWVEMMRRLVQAGVISLPVVSAAVRIHAGQVMMAQSHDELPQGVREALGDGPEVRGMRVTGKAGAGMSEPPQHHVLPREFREWFEKRGFTGDMSIDQFCVEMEQAHHEAIHGGGDWRVGRKWPGEWNQMIMEALRDAEAEAGRMLTQSEVLKVVAEYMRLYKIPMNFVPWRGL
ncbi:DUF2380 domain-containing protein [Vitiosangium sp. GDMCC 1.1324]|uniref:DUF2380 domain-containing protein n=1 Tax=Vitiosangium sp. (strain GDMCC 1.1324) TaxID=2138576 RepID=UPI001E2C7363|nr:DUF2380 domain-containing protein [Vitiosangium sp. GDMCC 1.1324]